MVCILELPEETILHVFKQYLTTEEQKPFYLCISKVCVKWNNICKDSIFWKRFDGSLPEKYFFELCQNGCLAKTEELIYPLSKELRYSEKLDKIFKFLPNLKSIDFSKVRHVDESTLSCLAKYCKKLCVIKFSQDDYSSELESLGYSAIKHKDMSFQKYKVSDKFLHDFLAIQGPSLTIIDISHSNISSFTKLLSLIAKCCNNLEKLFIENIKHAGKSSFPVDIIQNNCSKLKDLRLGFPVTFTQHQIKSLPGFPLLETFTHPNTKENSFTDLDLRNLLFKSPNLKTLDIRGCKSVSLNAISSLSANNLEQLYLSGTELHSNNSSLESILRKWMKTLSTLDISRTSSNSINTVFSSLVLNERMDKLECLDLSNTRINEGTLLIILENCDKLSSLNLTSCRSLGRGLNIEYVGKASLKKLLINVLCQFGRT